MKTENKMQNISQVLLKYQEELKAEFMVLSEFGEMMEKQYFNEKVLMLSGKSELLLKMTEEYENQKKLMK